MRITQSHILLNGLRFYARHGVGAQETVVGNEFTVDLRLKTDLAAAAQSDQLECTVSYADVFLAVKDEMSRPSKLLEHVAGRILKSIRKVFPVIVSAEVSIDKLNPPLGGKVGSSRVVMSF